MDRTEVERLLKRRSTLLGQPYGPDSIDAWTDMLDDRDAGATWKALHDLVRDGNAKVTVADLCRLTVDKAPKVAEQHGPSCGLCEGTGWEPCDDLERNNVRYSQVKPCRCTLGQSKLEVHAGILRHNGPLPTEEPDDLVAFGDRAQRWLRTIAEQRTVKESADDRPGYLR
jgi:hypothetical protein